MQGIATVEVPVIACPGYCIAVHEDPTVTVIHHSNPIDIRQTVGAGQDDLLPLFLTQYDGEPDGAQIGLGDHEFNREQAETLLASLSALVTIMREVQR